MKKCVLNMSGMLSEEGFSPEGAAIHDFSGLGGTSCYCDDESASVLRREIAGMPLDAVHWIDSGDYHYLSLFFMEMVSEPFELLHFDHHSDRQETAFGGILSCGSWVSEAERSLPLMRSVVSVGPEGEGDDGSGEMLPVYISLDLDVLSRDEFVTDWDQGKMSLEGMISEIRRLVSGRKVLGVDVCGGVTREKGASDSDLERNRQVHERLEKFLEILEMQ